MLSHPPTPTLLHLSFCLYFHPPEGKPCWWFSQLFQPLKRHQLHLWNQPVMLDTTIEYGRQLLFINVYKKKSDWGASAHTSVGSDHGSPTERQILITSRQNKAGREGEESKGLPREWGLGSWRSIAEDATINLKGGGGSRSNGTQTLCLWQVRTKNSKNAPSRKTFRKLCSHWLRGPWKRMVFTNTEK